MYGTKKIEDHIAAPKFYKKAKSNIVKLLKIILSGFPSVKFNIVLKSSYIRILVSEQSEGEDSVPNQEEIFPFASVSYQASRHHYSELKKYISKALHQMIRREEDFVNRGKQKINE